MRHVGCIGEQNAKLTVNKVRALDLALAVALAWPVALAVALALPLVLPLALALASTRWWTSLTRTIPWMMTLEVLVTCS